MNGYSKIRASPDFTTKSRSIDFSDLTFSPPPKEARENSVPPTLDVRQKEVDGKPHDFFSWQGGQGVGGQRFGVILTRNCSSASQRFRAKERTANGSGNTLQAVVRRAFSMRKAASVAESYWRIHDTADGERQEWEIIEEEEQQQHKMRSSKKSKGKILRACKRLFGF